MLRLGSLLAAPRRSCRAGRLLQVWSETFLGGRRSDLVVVAQICGIGFTTAFRVANLAFSDSRLTGTVLMGVLAGLMLSCLLAVLIVGVGCLARGHAPGGE